MTYQCKLPVLDLSQAELVLRVFEQKSEAADFRLSAEIPLARLKDYFDRSPSDSIGEVLAANSDTLLEWKTPSIQLRNGTSKSYFQFMQESLDKNEMYVAVINRPTRYFSRMTFHKLQLKSTVSRQIATLCARRFREALSIR